jgi:hypothetical protein
VEADLRRIPPVPLAGMLVGQEELLISYFYFRMKPIEQGHLSLKAQSCR